jgi:hypothetical protein
LFDRIGRKYGALVGYTLVTVSTLASAFSPAIEFMFVCRALQGNYTENANLEIFRKLIYLLRLQITMFGADNFTTVRITAYFDYDS